MYITHFIHVYNTPYMLYMYITHIYYTHFIHVYITSYMYMYITPYMYMYVPLTVDLIVHIDFALPLMSLTWCHHQEIVPHLLGMM